MNILTISNLVTWLLLGSFVAFMVLFVVYLSGGSLFGGARPYQRERRMVAAMCVAFSLLFLATCAKADVNRKLQCPNCNHQISSTYCPDCGHEAGVEIATAPICPTCGSEWDTAFCGDCGSSMNKEN